MKPEEVTPKLRKIFDDASPITDSYDNMINAGIAAVVTHLERDAGRGQLPPLTEVPEHVRSAIRQATSQPISLSVILAALNADRATPAASSPVIHKFGDQYVAVCGDDSVNHKTTEFWEYVTCKDCLKKGTATPADPPSDAMRFGVVADGTIHGNGVWAHELRPVYSGKVLPPLDCK